MALDAKLELLSAGGERRQVPIGEFYRLPGDTPQVEKTLSPGEMIAAVTVVGSPAARRSDYLKVRDRASFEFALVSAAVAIETNGGAVRDIRIAAGGVGTRPWRLAAVEAALQGAALKKWPCATRPRIPGPARERQRRTTSSSRCCDARSCARCRPFPPDGRT